MTTPGGYSAGTIFLQVVPSFKGFQDAVREEAKAANKAFGDEVAKQEKERAAEGKKAAAKRGEEEAAEYAGRFRTELKKAIARTQREVDAIEIGVESRKAVQEIERVKSELSKLGDAEIGVDLDADDAFADILRMKAAMESLQGTAATLDVEVDLGSAIAQLAALEATIDKLREVEVEVKVRSGGFARLLRKQVGEALEAIGEIHLTADSSDVDHELARIVETLTEIGDYALQPDVDLTEANVELERIEERLKRIAFEEVRPEVIVNTATAATKLSAIQKQLREIDGAKANAQVDVDTDKAQRGLRGLAGHLDENGSAFRAFNGLVLAGAIALPLLVPAAVAAAGAIAGIGVAALFAVPAIGTLIAGFSGIGDAVGALQDVQKNAARDALAASKTMRAAGRAVRDAERGVARAKQDAADAAQASARRIDAANRQVADAERRLQRAQEDSTRAQERLVDARREAQDQLEDLALRARGGALAERQAVIDLFEAQVAYNNAQADGGATNKEREEAAIALERARLGLEQIRLENGRVAEEQAEAARTGVEGSDLVVAAQEDVVDANQRVKDAQQAVADAARDAREAQQDAARSAADSAQAMADAQLRLSDAQVAYGEALQSTNEIGSASAQKLEEAMGKLGPAGQAFATFLAEDVLPFLREIRESIQEGLLPGVQTFLTALMEFAPQIKQFFGSMGKALGDVFGELAQMFKSPVWIEFFQSMARYAPIFMRLWAKLGAAVGTILAQLIVALAPLAEDMLTFLVDAAESLSAFLASAEGQQFLKDFMTAVRDMGPQVMDFLVALVGALWNLGKALAPYAELLLGFFTGFLEFVASMPPDVLGALALAIIALVFAFQALVGLAAFAQALATVALIVGAIAGAAGLTVGALFLVIGVIVAVVAALVILYTNSETFRDIVNAAFEAVGKVFKWIWENILKPVLDLIVWNLRFMSEVAVAVFDLFIKAAQKAWEGITDGWNWFMNTGAGKAIASFWQDTVQPAWSAFAEWVGGFWDGMVELFKGGLRLGISVINEGLIDPFNTLADFFGSKRIERVQVPKSLQSKKTQIAMAASVGRTGVQQYATGGFVSGFSPSPTADNIPAMLTAGEYVLPVGAVNALRAKYGDSFLELLRMGLPGFANGGLVGFGRMLQGRGFRVSEHPAFGGVHPVHSKNSRHYAGKAIDVNWAAGESDAEKRAIDAIVGLAEDYGLRTIWRTAGHFNHAHFDEGGGRSILGKVGGAISGIVGEVKDAAGKVIGAPLQWLRTQVNGAASILPQTGFGSVLGGGIRTLLGYAVDKLVSAGAEVGDFFTADNKDAPPQGYAAGGEVKLYDNGGWLQPGLTNVLNASGRPEPVFSASQWETLERSGAGGGGPLIGSLTTQQGATAAEVVDEIVFNLRGANRGGVHAVRG